MNWFDTLKAKSKGQRALSEWTREDWGYVSPKSKKKGRYAPKAVADSMSSSEKAYENRKKREGTKQGKQHVPRGKSAKKKKGHIHNSPMSLVSRACGLSNLDQETNGKNKS